MTEEKTEQPTPARLRRAIREGDSGISVYVGQAVSFCVALALVPAVGAATSSRARASLLVALQSTRERGAPVGIDAQRVAMDVVSLAFPLLLAVAVVSAAVSLIQTGGSFAVGKLSPDFAKLDPIAGLRGLVRKGRFFGVLRSVVVAAAVGYLVYVELGRHAADLAHTVDHFGAVPTLGAELSRRVATRVAIFGLAVAAVDIAVVRRSWMKRLRMSREEIRREHKESEGDPQMKAARERARREMMAQATTHNVKNASVVVVNPTHVACALKYKEEEDSAPVVVASGEGELAERIIRAARDYGIPIVRDVPLAQALKELEVGDAIPEALYEAVAEILRAAWEEEGKTP
jgi:FlhB-like protein